MGKFKKKSFIGLPIYIQHFNCILFQFRILSGKDARYYEGEKKPKIKHDRPGLVSMVNCGDNLYVEGFQICFIKLIVLIICFI